MAKRHKLVTSQVETNDGNNTEPNTFSYDTNGEISYYDSDSIQHPFMDPGIVYGANHDSSDHSNLDTIKLIPDPTSAYTFDQYLIVEPTTPNHIHIRAGGTQDDSNATLILGGERNNVTVSDNDRTVGISTRYAEISNTYLNTNPDSNQFFVTGSTADIQTGYTVNIDGFNYTVDTIDTIEEGVIGVRATGATFAAGQNYTFAYNAPWNHQWTFGADGVLYGPLMGTVKVLNISNSSAGNNLSINADAAALDLQAYNELNITATNGNVWIAAQNGGKISLSGTDGAFLGNPDVAHNRITTRLEVPFINAAVPTSSLGQEGDVVGFGAMTSGYIYYCTGTYNATTHIWKRVAWSNDTWGV